MANVISGTDYLAIAQSYADARTSILASITSLFDAVYLIVQLNDIDPSVDLLQDFANSYQINADQLRSPVTMLSAVRRLNNHVLNRGGYTDLASFFDDTSVGITVVPDAWADLCKAAGYDIDEYKA